MAKVSIIIPAYNAERSLERAVRSVLAQTLKDIEVWISDDGSTDGTRLIAEKLAQGDSRVRVWHQDNRGAYEARRAAAEKSSAPYLAFVDADDTIEPTMYEKMVALAELHDLDVVQCGVWGRPCDDSVDLLLNPSMVREKYVIPYIIEGRGSSFVWDKLYSRRVWRVSERSSFILMYDDLDINIQVFLDVTKIGIIHSGYYHYEVNAGSSVRNYRSQNIIDFCTAIRLREEFASGYDLPEWKLLQVNWIVKNARNQLISASSASAQTFRMRCENVNKILSIPEVADALTRTTDKRSAAMIRAYRAFGVFAVILVYFLKRVKGLCG